MRITRILAPAIAGALVTYAAAAAPIRSCRHLLDDALNHLVQVEFDSYTNARAVTDSVDRLLSGFLLVLHEAQLDGEILARREARSFVPVTPPTANKLFDEAATRGLLKISRSTKGTGRSFLIEPGPQFADVVTTRLITHLDQLLETARAITPLDVMTSRSPTASAHLTRLLIQKAWADFDRAWQVSGPEQHRHLRHTYGLLLRLYQLDLRGESLTQREARALISHRDKIRRIELLSEVARAGLIELRESTAFWSEPRVFAGPKLIKFVEARLDQNIKRMNIVLNAVETVEHRAAAE